MRYLACTSFSPEGYKVYGKRFLESFLRHWPIEIVVFYEDQKPDLDNDRILYLNLCDDREFTSFQAEYGFFGTTDYRLMATKFSPKVFSITSNRIPQTDWLIWVDADVETFKDVDETFFDKTCLKEFNGSYIGRKDWDHSECGFVSYNLGNGGKEFLEDFRSLYSTGMLFSLPQWHDSYAFDYIREQNGNKFFNLAQDLSGMHPWPETILGDYMVHSKGPKAKIETYGSYA